MGSNMGISTQVKVAQVSCNTRKAMMPASLLLTKLRAMFVHPKHTTVVERMGTHFPMVREGAA